MNLAEVLIAAVLFTLSAGSSLQIWSLISLAAVEEERRQQLADRLDGELAGLDAWLRLQAQQAVAHPPCGQSAGSLQTLLVSRAPSAGVQRQTSLLAGSDGVLLELAIEGLPLRRRRLVLPAALGLCTPAPQPAQVAGPGGGGHG